MPSTRAIVASLALAALAAACNPPGGDPEFAAAGSPTPRRGGVLRFAAYQPVRTLDPAIGYDEISFYATHSLFDTLLGYAAADRNDPRAGLALEPHLAESWSVSDDGKTYRFVLREGITYSDGQPVVAGDFEYALERVLRTPASPFGGFLIDVEGAREVTEGKSQDCTGIVADDDRHLTVRLTRPYPAFKYIVAMAFATPQKKDWVEASGDQLRRRPLGTGPFVLDSWSEGERLVLRRNERYWNPAVPHLDGVVMLENIPRQLGFLMFQRGEIDTADRPPAPEYLRLAQSEAWRPYIQRAAAMNTYGERMNVRMKPFTDRRVRQALNYALSKDHTVKVLNTGAVPSHGILPPGMFGRDETLAPYPYDPDKARRLLAEAGYPDGFEIEYVQLNDDESEKVAQALQADLARVGVRVNIRLMSIASYITAVGKPDGLAFSYAGWLMDFPDPSNFVDAKFHSRMIADENANNDAFYSNPALDALIDQARGEVDVTAREELYHRIERVLYDDAPWIWNYHRLFIEVSQPYVKGYTPHPVWGRVFEHAWLDVRADGTRPRLEAP
jgi:oligopeptide transport system substrate-binding protein